MRADLWIALRLIIFWASVHRTRRVADSLTEPQNAQNGLLAPECPGDRAMTQTTWQRTTEWPLTISALAFLAAYAIPIINPDIPSRLAQACEVIVWGTWVLFGVDFIVRVALADRRARYVLRHWLDVLIIALPLLRPLRLLRLASLLKVLNRHATTGLRGKVVIYVAGGAALLAFCGALAVLDAERDNPDANITDFGDAMWWAVTTMTTVGYGDRYPTTGEGRLAAALLMVGGIALLGSVTATIASWLVEQVDRVAEERETADLRTQVELLNIRIDQLLGQGSEASRLSGTEPCPLTGRWVAIGRPSHPTTAFCASLRS
jgi:voltage-gated potassium channel